MSSSSFAPIGYHLSSELNDRNLSLSEAAKLFGVSEETLTFVQRGDTSLDWVVIRNWLVLLHMPEEKIRYLKFIYESGSLDWIQELYGNTDRRRPTLTHEIAHSIIGLQDQITDISSALADITNQVEEGEVVERLDAGADSLSAGLHALMAKVEKLEATGDRLTAQVEVPTPDRMKVKLVPSTLISQMEEYRSDSVIWYSLAGAFGGAVLGVYVNWATGGELSSAALVLTGIFVLLMAVFIILIRRNEQRLDIAKSQMLGIDISPYHHIRARRRFERAIWAHNFIERFLGAEANLNASVTSTDIPSESTSDKARP